jgi:TolB-like protein/Tfp pilus assembly protein PilF
VIAISSIAVLPFVTIGPEPERTAYFSEGLTEELITALGRLPGLRVAARSTSSRFRDSTRDLRQIRDELKVDAVIEGSVRIAGTQLRVTVQLVDAAEASSLWSGTYDRSLGDIFAVQEEICRAIAARLPVEPPVAGRPLVKRYTQNVEAYQLYLTGRYLWNRRSREGFERAIEYWKRAIALAPDYPLSYVGVADAYVLLAYFGYLPPHVAFATVADAAQKALAIDPDLAEAHVPLGNLRLHYEWDLEAAGRELRRAVSLDPSYAYAPHILSHYWVAAGDLPRSLEASQQAMDLAPLDLVFIAHLGWHYYHAGDYERGAATCRRAIEMEPRFVMARIYLGHIYSQSGQWPEALAEFETVLTQGGSADVQGCIGLTLARAGRHEEARTVLAALEGEAASRYVSPYRLATIHLALGDRDRALSFLERAVEDRACAITYMRTDPALVPLHGDARFSALLDRVWCQGGGRSWPAERHLDWRRLRNWRRLSHGLR